MSMRESIKPKIIHIMSDGTVRPDIKDMVIPANEEMMPAYLILANIKRKVGANERVAS